MYNILINTKYKAINGSMKKLTILGYIKQVINIPTSNDMKFNKLKKDSFLIQVMKIVLLLGLSTDIVNFLFK